MPFTIILKEFLESYEIDYTLTHKTKNIAILYFDLSYIRSVVRFLNLEHIPYILHKYRICLINPTNDNFMIQ